MLRPGGSAALALALHRQKQQDAGTSGQIPSYSDGGDKNSSGSKTLVVQENMRGKKPKPPPPKVSSRAAEWKLAEERQKKQQEQKKHRDRVQSQSPWMEGDIDRDDLDHRQQCQKRHDERTTHSKCGQQERIHQCGTANLIPGYQQLVEELDINDQSQEARAAKTTSAPSLDSQGIQYIAPGEKKKKMTIRGKRGGKKTSNDSNQTAPNDCEHIRHDHRPHRRDRHDQDATDSSKDGQQEEGHRHSWDTTKLETQYPEYQQLEEKSYGDDRSQVDPAATTTNASATTSASDGQGVEPNSTGAKRKKTCRRGKKKSKDSNQTVPPSKISSRALQWKTAEVRVPGRVNAANRAGKWHRSDGNFEDSCGDDDDAGTRQQPLLRPARPPPPTTTLSAKGKRMVDLLDRLRVIGTGDNDALLKRETIKSDALNVVNEWAEERIWTLEEADMAASILRQLEGIGLMKITRVQYTSVINAYAKCPSNYRAARHAKNVLDHMERKSRESNDPGIWPNRVAINTVIGAYAKCAELGSAASAERLLDKLERDYANGDLSRRPNQRSYGKVIDAYAMENNPAKAEEIMKRLERQVELLNPCPWDLELNVVPYTSVIQAYAAKHGAPIPTCDAERAEQILRDVIARSIKPDVQMFTSVINCWAQTNCKSKALKVFNILKLMDQLSDLQGDTNMYNCYINSLVSSGSRRDLKFAEELLQHLEEHATEQLRPDSYSYNGVLKGYAQLGMGIEAEKLIDHWRERYFSGVVREMPDAVSYATLMKCWIKNGGCQEGMVACKATDILEYMESNNVKPTTVTYNTVLNAWARAAFSDDKASIKAAEIWNRMRNRDKLSYIAIITCHARCDCAQDAFKFMCQGLESGEFAGDLRVYAELLAACSRDSRVDDSMGERVLEWIGRHAGKPDTACYNSILVRFAKKPSLQGAQKAIELTKRMERAQVRPNEITYSLMVAACQLDSGYLVDLFTNCVESGFLDHDVESAFRKFGPPLIQEQLRHTKPAWSRNASRPTGGSRKSKCWRDSRKDKFTGKRVDDFAW